MYSKLVCSSLHILLFSVKFPWLFHVSYFSVHNRQYLSSANWITFSVVVILDEKSFIYKRKMSGPETVPCGTPWFTISQSENMPLCFAVCLRLARNENSNSFASWEKPYISIFLRKMFCEMELNAFARSRKIATVYLLWSKLEETVSTSSKTASVADFFFWNSNCSLYKFMFINEIHHLSPKEALKDFLHNSELQILVDSLCYLFYHLFCKLVLHRLVSF